MERVKGIEPSSQAWEAHVLPLNHTRNVWSDSLSIRILSESKSLFVPVENARSRRNHFAGFAYQRDIFAPAACDEQIDVTVPVQIRGANVVGFLVSSHEVVGECSLAVVLEAIRNGTKAPPIATDTTGCSITGGAFYNPTTMQFPSGYVGDYFFADFCSGWIRTYDPITGAASGFATGLEMLIDLEVSKAGQLFYLTRGSAASVGKIGYAAN